MSTINRIEVRIPFPLKWVNSYYIQDSVPTLIDTGINTEEGFQAVSLAIRKNAGALADIKRIILTHGHLDHMGLAGRIADISGAEVFIHLGDRDKIVKGMERETMEISKGYCQFFREAGLHEDLVQEMINFILLRFRKFVSPLSRVNILAGGETFGFDDFQLKVIHSPGHSAGSICLFNEDDGTFFSGDSLLEKITPNAVIEIENKEVRNGYKSLICYLRSLEVISALDVSLVLPGHGSPFSSHRKRIEEIKKHHRLRKQEVLNILKAYEERLLERLDMTVWMITQQLFPNIKFWDIFLGLSETQGHLEILEEETLITSCKVNNERFYRLAQ